MNYLSRPVFLQVTKSFEPGPGSGFAYNLSPLQLGAGESTFERIQKHVLQTWDIAIDLLNDSEIEAFESFFDDLDGGRKGFWFPAPFEVCDIIAGDTATTFDISDNQFRDIWDAGADVHLFFVNHRTGTIHASKVTAVDPELGEVERVTIADALSIDENFTAGRLLFVKLKNNGFLGASPADGNKIVEFSVEEIPLEYDSAVEGKQVCYLYEFTQNFQNGTVSVWRLTSFDIDLTDGVNTWTAFNLTHGNIEQNLELNRDSCQIQVAAGSAHPLNQFIPFPPDFAVNVTIYEGEHDGSGGAINLTIIFSGKINGVQPEGAKITARAEGIKAILDRNFPGVMIAPRCQTPLFSDYCKIDPAGYKKTGTITFHAEPNKIRVTNPAFTGTEENEFAGGYMDTGATNQREVRLILANSAESSGNVDFIIDRAFEHALPGQSADVFPGCDGTAQTCKGKFDNLENFRGFPNISTGNLSIEAMPTQNPKGNKK